MEVQVPQYIESGTPIVGQVAALNKALELAFTNFSKRYEYVKK